MNDLKLIEREKLEAVVKQLEQKVVKGGMALEDKEKQQSQAY